MEFNHEHLYGHSLIPLTQGQLPVSGEKCAQVQVPVNRLETKLAKEKCGEVITKTCLYNFDPLKPHFYIVKLGFTGVYFIFLISASKT